MDQMTLTLNSPITEEQWDMITDVDFDHTDSITFHTKHGKEVEFVKRKTGKWSGLWSEPQDDKSIYGKKLIEGDTVYLLGIEGTVIQENGAWGWGSCNYVPWELLENKIPHNNKPSFCYCDNFISFWELKWNFDDGEDWDGVPFIRHNCGAKMEGEQP